MNIKKIPLWSALVTPFKENLSVDYESLKHLIENQALANNGILVLGSTGEALSLSMEEKKDIVNFICDLELKIPLMVGIPNANAFDVFEWLEFCNQLPIDAYFAATPAYAKPGMNAQINWFTKVFEASTRPIMLYNIPSRTGAELFPEVIRSLEDHPNLWALKDSSGSVEKAIGYINASKKLSVYSGEDGLIPCFAPFGAKGLVSVAANAWPTECRKYVEQSLTNTFQPTTMWWSVYKAIFSVTNPVPIKAMLKELGVISCKSVRLPLSENEPFDITNLLKAHKSIQNWMQQQTQLIS